MFLSRIHLDQRCPEVRRDLSDPYELHSTLCRAFSAPQAKCPKGEFLWRQELEADQRGLPHILVQSRSLPDWSGIGIKGWLAAANPPIDIVKNLDLSSLMAGRRFRFRLRANPCVTRKGKRLGLFRREDQEIWLENKGGRHGFSMAISSSQGSTWRDIGITQERMLKGKQRSGISIHVYSVLYDGVLVVTDPKAFIEALQNGIGHGKTLGLGLLSIAPLS